MTNYTDYTSGARVESTIFPEVRPAITLTAPDASQRVYERGSIAETIQKMFNEAEQYPMYWQSDQEYAWEVHPSETEMFQSFMTEIQETLKNSDAVKNLRRKAESDKEIAEHDVQAVFRSYENAFRTVLSKMKSELSTKQMNVLKFHARSELDYSFRDVITKHLVMGSEHELKFDPLDFFLMINPKARKVDYMSKSEILATLRHSMSLPAMSAERLKNDVRAIESLQHRPDFQDITSSQEYKKIHQ